MTIITSFETDHRGPDGQKLIASGVVRLTHVEWSRATQDAHIHLRGEFVGTLSDGRPYIDQLSYFHAHTWQPGEKPGDEPKFVPSETLTEVANLEASAVDAVLAFGYRVLTTDPRLIDPTPG